MAMPIESAIGNLLLTPTPMHSIPDRMHRL